MKWIKASERMPTKRPEKYFVKYGTGSNGTLHLESFNKWNVTEWLDESQPAPVQEGKSIDEIIEKHIGLYSVTFPKYLHEAYKNAAIEYAAMEHYRNQSTGLREGEYQKRVTGWMMECFSMEICRDIQERNHRFLEEALELVQSLGCTKEEVAILSEYVFGRPNGNPSQEVGGVMVTLAALCTPADIDMMNEAEKELGRISTPELITKIRNKQATKPKHSPLPQSTPLQPSGGREGLIEIIQKAIDEAEETYMSEKNSADWFNNNTPNVGITVDYQSWSPLPKWVKEAKDFIAQSATPSEGG